MFWATLCQNKSILVLGNVMSEYVNTCFGLCYVRPYQYLFWVRLFQNISILVWVRLCQNISIHVWVRLCQNISIIILGKVMSEHINTCFG
jgi:hypothetical protein